MEPGCYFQIICLNQMCHPQIYVCYYLQLMTVKRHVSKPQNRFVTSLRATSPITWGTNKDWRFLSGRRRRWVVGLPPADRGRQRCYNLWQQLRCSTGADFIYNVTLRVCPAEQQRDRKLGDLAFANTAGFFFSLHRVSKANFPVCRDGTGTELRLRICCQRTSKQIQLEIFSLPLPALAQLIKSLWGFTVGKKFKLKIEGFAASMYLYISTFIHSLRRLDLNWWNCNDSTWTQTIADLWKVLLFRFYGSSVMTPPCAGFLLPPHKDQQLVLTPSFWLLWAKEAADRLRGWSSRLGRLLFTDRLAVQARLKQHEKLSAAKIQSVRIQSKNQNKLTRSNTVGCWWCKM